MGEVKTVKWDLETAKYIVDKAVNDRAVFPVKLEECNQCGAAYIPELGHDCSKIIEVPCHESEED